MSPEDVEDIENNLSKLVTDIIPTDNFESFGKQYVNKVKSLIMRKSGYSIDRCIFAGSFGKHTDILVPDFDVVFFINDHRPPFGKVLDEWHGILQKEEGGLIVDGSLKKTSISLQFEIDTKQGVLQVDVLPAANLIPKHIQPRPGGKQLAGMQKSCAQGLITGRNYNSFSSSLCEFQISFMKDQTEFTHQVVRLGKFWFKTLYLGPKRIYGIKTVLELIAVSVGINEEDESDKNNQTPSLYYAFIAFLDEVSQIDQLGLAFKKNSHTRNWERTVPVGYSDDDVFIIDPSNSKNDLSKYFKNREQEIHKLKAFAKTTRNKMEVQSVTKPSIIFRPQPKFFKVLAELNFRKPIRFFCEPDREYKSFFCEMEIRTSRMETEVVQKVLQLIQNILLTYTRASSSEVSLVETTMSDTDESYSETESEEYWRLHYEEVSSNDSNESVDVLQEVSDSVRRFIWEQIMEKSFGPEGMKKMKKATRLRYQDSDVVFRIPAQKCPTAGGLSVGFKWD